MSDTCSKCGKEIFWVVSDTGARVPLDPKAKIFRVEAVADGDPIASPVRNPMDGLTTGNAYMVTHFATCPNAAEFSGRSGKPAETERNEKAKGKPIYTDDDKFPFGKYKGAAFKDVPSTYFDWLRGIDWVKDWPGIVAYMSEGNATGRAISKDVDTNEEREEDNIPF